MEGNRRLPRRIAAVHAALLAGVAWAAIPGLAVAQSGPSDQDFKNAGKQSSDWILPAGDYSGNRLVKESEIGPDNVKQLKVAWTFKIPAGGPVEASPIVWDGTVYVTSYHDDVYALDAKTGKLKWQYNPKPDQLVGFPRNRGVAVYDGNVYVAMINGHLVSLDAKTGKVNWDKLTVANNKDSFYTMQPVPYKGKLLLGVSDGDWGGIGNISAFDPKTGRRLWEWQSIPAPGQKGHDTWSGDSWKRGGGTIWNGVAIDPDTDTLYVTTGNPQPDFFGDNRKGKNLYTDSMVALDISGAKPKMKWFHQFIAHDTHDWDPAMPPVRFQGTVNGKTMQLVAAGDKGGNFWILNAENGHLISNTPVSYQMNQNSEPPKKGSNYACPNTNGGVEFNGGAYDPATNTFFVPSTSECGQWSAEKEPEYVPGQFYLGGKFPSLVGPNTGWFNAINVSTGVFSWRHHLGLPNNGSALVMDYSGSGQTTGSAQSSGTQSIVFSGTVDGHFNAYDTQSGKVLWSHDTGASINAPAATFTMDNSRYVLVASGGPGFLKVPELKNPSNEAQLTAFVEGPAQGASQQQSTK